MLMAADPIHQFQIIDLFPVAKIGNVEIAFTNSAAFMMLAVVGLTAFLVGATAKRSLVPSRLQSAADILFTERGHSTNLVPNRDSGVQLSGNLIPNVLEYQLGVFDGATDNANIANDSDNQKDVAYRIFATPFSQSGAVWLQGFGIGWAGSTGKHLGNATTTQLPSYKTPGQLTFFKFASGAFANGKETRSSPEA